MDLLSVKKQYNSYNTDEWKVKWNSVGSKIENKKSIGPTHIIILGIGSCHFTVCQIVWTLSKVMGMGGT